jgi:hypothetical protein
MVAEVHPIHQAEHAAKYFRKVAFDLKAAAPLKMTLQATTQPTL